MSTPHHPQSSCSPSHVHSSPPTVYLFPVMSTPHHPPSTCFQSCPLLTSTIYLLPLLTTHQSTCSTTQSCPHHPLATLTTHRLPISCHVHSSPPTLYLSSHVHSTTHRLLFPVMSTPHHPPSTSFQSCPLITTHRLLFPVMSLHTTHCLSILHPGHFHFSPSTV